MSIWWLGKRGKWWKQTLKNRISLENYFLPGDLKVQFEALVDYYNHQRYHESINNGTPADVYGGRNKAILKQWERSNEKHSKRNACIIASTPQSQTNKMIQTLS